jgi:hypothetical protein
VRTFCIILVYRTHPYICARALSYTLSNDRMIMNNELESMWKEVVTA